MNDQSTWHPTWHQVVKVHGLSYLALGTSKRGVFDAKLGVRIDDQIEILYCHGGILNYPLIWISINNVGVPQHGPLSMNVKLVGQSFAKFCL